MELSLNLVEYHIDAGLGLIVLSNPEKGNLLNHQFLKEFKQAFDTLQADPEVRVILYRSSREVFCHGMDLSSVSKKLDIGADDDVRIALGLYSDMLEDIFNCPKPVVSFVRGEVKAGGFGLACAADIVITTPEANFELGEVIFGLIPANVMVAVIGLRIHPQRLKYLVLTAKKIFAKEAYDLGLVDEVFEDDKAEKSIRDILKRLFKSSPKALAETKAFTRQLLESAVESRGDMARNKILELVGSQDVRQTLNGYMEGDMPPWFAPFKPKLSLTGIGE